MALNFDDFKLNDNVLKGLYAYGFEKPSEIQRQGLPTLVSGKNLMAQAPGGTGKTGLYAIAILQRLCDLNVEPLPRRAPSTSSTSSSAPPSPSSSHSCSNGSSSTDPSAWVLVPSRELAQGVSHLIQSLGVHCTYSSMAVCGGTSRTKDLQALKEGRNVIVGTPGRFLDMLSRGLSPSGLSMLVIDELDELLSRDFKQILYELHDLVVAASPQVQLAMFSTSVGGEVRNAINDLMREPFCIHQPTDQPVSLDYALQFYVDVEKAEWKYHVLLDLAELLSPLLVFCNSKKKAAQLHEQLGVSSMLVEGTDTREAWPDKTFFVTGEVLKDRPSVKAHVNFDLPAPELYLSRVGVSGRYGTKRLAISFVTREELSRLRALEAYFATSISELPLNFNELV